MIPRRPTVSEDVFGPGAEKGVTAAPFTLASKGLGSVGPSDYSADSPLPSMRNASPLAGPSSVQHSASVSSPQTQHLPNPAHSGQSQDVRGPTSGGLQRPQVDKQDPLYAAMMQVGFTSVWSHR